MPCTYRGVQELIAHQQLRGKLVLVRSCHEIFSLLQPLFKHDRFIKRWATFKKEVASPFVWRLVWNLHHLIPQLDSCKVEGLELTGEVKIPLRTRVTAVTG